MKLTLTLHIKLNYKAYMKEENLFTTLRDTNNHTQKQKQILQMYEMLS